MSLVVVFFTGLGIGMLIGIGLVLVQNLLLHKE